VASYLKVELIYGGIARSKRQKDTLRGLGLRHRHQQKILQDTPSIRGMIRKVFDLVKFEETKSAILPVVAKVETYKLGAVTAPKVKKPKPERAAKAEGETASHPHKKTAKAAKAKKTKKAPAKHHTAASKSAAKTKKGK
jgi:large subunit ribosomal protein L30